MNKLHVYTGEGKGKTTAAMGLAVRSLGHGNRVLIGQFVKDGRSGELIALAQMPRAFVYPAKPLEGFLSGMPEEGRQAARAEHRAYVQALMEKTREVRPQTIILDELGMALALDMVTRDEAQALLDCALQYGETVATGRCVPAWLLDRADYVSRMTPERHPYETERLPGRRGVEW